MVEKPVFIGVAMNCFVFLAFLIAQLFPAGVPAASSPLWAAVQPSVDSADNAFEELSISFSTEPMLEINTPVVLKGQFVGRVLKIEASDSEIFQVKLEVSADVRRNLQFGTVALLTSPLLERRPRGSSLVELLPPTAPPQSSTKPVLEPLNGYGSFVGLWTASRG